MWRAERRLGKCEVQAYRRPHCLHLFIRCVAHYSKLQIQTKWHSVHERILEHTDHATLEISRKTTYFYVRQHISKLFNSGCISVRTYVSVCLSIYLSLLKFLFENQRTNTSNNWISCNEFELALEICIRLLTDQIALYTKQIFRRKDLHKWSFRLGGKCIFMQILWF